METKQYLSDKQVIKMGISMVIGMIAMTLDSTIVAIAINTLVKELNTNIATVQWVSTGYVLALGVSITFVAWAQARFGGKKLWLFALALFMISSLLCALSWNVTSLIAFRVIQGLAGGMLMPLMQSTLAKYVDPKKLSKIMTTVALPIAIGPILGPVLGGIILNWLSWRWIFLVNIPVCLLGLYLAWINIPNDDASVDKTAKLDIFGVFTLPLSLLSLLYGLSNVHKIGGFGRLDVLIFLAIGLLLIGIFAYHALHTSTPLVDIVMLKKESVSFSAICLFLISIALLGVAFILPLYWQTIKGYSVLKAGFMIAPQGIGMLLIRPFVPKLMEKFNPRYISLAGFILVIIGLLPFSVMQADSNIYVLMLGAFIIGMGIGVIFIPITVISMTGLKPSEIPHVSVITRVFQQIGGSFGTAILAVILQQGLNKVFINSGYTPVMAFQTTFRWLIVLTLLAILFIFISSKKSIGGINN